MDRGVEGVVASNNCISVSSIALPVSSCRSIEVDESWWDVAIPGGKDHR